MLIVKRVEFVSGRMSYMILRGRWCNIIVLNVHAPTEDKIDDTKDSFYEELERVFDKFPKYHMKILYYSILLHSSTSDDYFTVLCANIQERDTQRRKQ
jgi:hypothetical protein